MYINIEKCIKCKKCIPFCPVEAIVEKDGKITIDFDTCLECGVCEKHANCPTNAIYNVHLDPPRAYRKAFSDPFGKHENTSLKHMGRGTEEVKTNDVTGIVNDLNKVAFAVELGRPSISASFKDIEKISMAVAPYVVKFEPNNPVISLIIDKETGKLDPVVLNERVLSAIVEFTCSIDNIALVVKTLEKVAGEIDTVFSTGIICKVDETTNSIPAYDILKSMNIDVNKSSSKTNMGLGRPRYEDRIKEGK